MSTSRLTRRERLEHEKSMLIDEIKRIRQQLEEKQGRLDRVMVNLRDPELP